MAEKGLVHVYTGDGKGKTTAALGLSVRAAGRGKRVLFYQFLKPVDMVTGERLALEKAGLGIELEALDADWDMCLSPGDEQACERVRERIRQALQQIGLQAQQGSFDLIVLDELVYCLSRQLARFEDVKTLMQQRAQSVEIVLTGRGASDELIELADLVTEMRNIKHPFDKGIGARPGVEF